MFEETAAEALRNRISEAVVDELRVIEGRLKTLMEAITEEGSQCEARKDSVSTAIWQTTSYLWDRIDKIIEVVRKE